QYLGCPGGLSGRQWRVDRIFAIPHRAAIGTCVVGALEDLVGVTESPLKGGVIPTRLSVLVAVQQLPGLIGDPCRGRTVDRQLVPALRFHPRWRGQGQRVRGSVIDSRTDRDGEK